MRTYLELFIYIKKFHIHFNFAKLFRRYYYDVELVLKHNFNLLNDKKYDETYANHYLKKELDKLENERFRKILVSHFNYFYSKVEAFSFIKEENDHLYTFKKDNKKNFHKIMFNIDMQIMRMMKSFSSMLDIYTMSRLEKPYIKRSLIYVGNAHAKMMHKTLIRLGYKKVFLGNPKERKRYMCVGFDLDSFLNS